MKWVNDYLRYEQACRDLASILTKPDDKRALELMATAPGPHELPLENG